MTKHARTISAMRVCGQPADTADEAAKVFGAMLRRGWTADRVLRYIVEWVRWAS